MRLTILASSSAGNAALVRLADGQCLLIDAGLSFRRLEELLAAEGVTPRQIAAALITHEHSDHVAGLAGLAALGIRVYATRGTALALNIKKCQPAWQVIPSEGVFGCAGVRVESFVVPHDAAEPVGYVIDDGVNRLVWALDVGHLAAGVKKILKSASILVLESNYCPRMLEADTRRPFSLKQRIRGRHGHLSNDEAFDFISREYSPSWKEIHLAHLSGQCNDPEALEARYSAAGLAVRVVRPQAAALAEV